jgi:hypothetical protein
MQKMERQGADATRPVVSLRQVTAEVWDNEILPTLDYVCQEQLYAFARLRYAGTRIEPLVFEADGAIVGGCLMLVKPLPLNITAVAIAKWGPNLRDETAPMATALYRGMVSALVEEYANRRHMLVSVMPRPAIDLSEFEQLTALGFTAGPQLRAPDRYYVAVRRDDAAMRKGFAGKWRNHLNKAERSGLVFERATPDKEPEFGALFQTMLARKQYVDHSAYDTIPTLLTLPDETARFELFFARHEGEAVAGAVVIKAGRTATYLYGASNATALKLNAGHFLQYNIVRWLRDNARAEWYNLGGHDESEGLRTFKAGMVGTTGIITPFAPSAQIATHFIPGLLGSSAVAMRQALVRGRRAVDDFRERTRKAPAPAPAAE